MICRSHTLELDTHAPIELIDITERVADFARDADVRDGFVHVFVRHTTAAVRIQEAEPLLLDDLRRFLAALAPADAPYAHNDFRIRTQHMHPDERPNGHAHCLQLLMGSSEIVPIRDGALQLGAWQRVFLVELDGPRPRRDVQLQALGTALDASAGWRRASADKDASRLGLALVG